MENKEVKLTNFDRSAVVKFKDLPPEARATVINWAGDFPEDVDDFWVSQCFTNKENTMVTGVVVTGWLDSIAHPYKYVKRTFAAVEHHHQTHKKDIIEMLAEEISTKNLDNLA